MPERISPPAPTANDYHVIVVGYGPSGAMAANMLGSSGIRTLVLERELDVYDKPRAIALDHEIVRTLDNYGLLECVRDYIAPFDDSNHFGAEYQILRTITAVPEPYPLGYTPSMVFSQPPFEAALRTAAAAKPEVSVELGAELIGLTEIASSVHVTYRDAQGVTTIATADYVIACDGASSTVRQLLGIDHDDLAFDEPWVVVDMLMKPNRGQHLPPTSAHFCVPDRPIAYINGLRSHKRWEIMLNPDEDPAAMQAPEQVWSLLSRWVTPEDADLWRAASYRFHALVAKRWRAGNVFLAGDAAHQQPPILGQGMCQGVRDVTNLVWKLGHVLRAEASDALLQTYEEERRGHVRNLIESIVEIGKVLCERDPARAIERDRALLAESGGVPSIRTRQDILPPLTNGFLGKGRGAGELFPQPWMLTGAGRALMDQVHGHGWRLIVADGAHVPEDVLSMATDRGLRVLRLVTSEGHQSDYSDDPREHRLLEVDGVLRDWLKGHSCRFVAVRPDHYVYGTAESADTLRPMLSGLSAGLASGRNQLPPIFPRERL